MISQPTTRADGLLVKIRQGSETGTLKALRHQVGTIQSTRLCRELLWHHIRGKKLSNKNPGNVFDIAHGLLGIAGILAIEPNLEISQNGGQQITDETDPATHGKYTWHIQQVKADQARKEFSVTGEGVRVAHLDTGYTEHPELVIGTAIRADLGYNFYENNRDPMEPLKTIDEGHGTATASVLVGLEGKQHGEGSVDAFVEGVAPGAELVPIRVDKDVVIWRPAEEISGICHALEQNCHVISMSRGGGLDYDSLHEAIKLAISRGTVVIAAASNCYGGCEVRYPAKYEEVICAAGSTYSMTPWDKSSRGPEVTIAAPAYSVYRARTRNKNNSYAFDVERSNGTSYSTPIVAGAAALWIQRHGGAAALARMLNGSERIAPSFKHLLRTSGFQTGKDWDTAQFGPGILDCVRLLSSALPKQEDITTIGILPRPTASRRRLAEQMFSSQMGMSVDPRAIRLLSLEIEAATIQYPQIKSLLAAATEGAMSMRSAGRRNLAEALITGDTWISTTLRRALEY